MMFIKGFRWIMLLKLFLHSPLGAETSFFALGTVHE